jgi:hypothetical protein
MSLEQAIIDLTKAVVANTAALAAHSEAAARAPLPVAASPVVAVAATKPNGIAAPASAASPKAVARPAPARTAPAVAAPPSPLSGQVSELAAGRAGALAPRAQPRPPAAAAPVGVTTESANAPVQFHQVSNAIIAASSAGNRDAAVALVAEYGAAKASEIPQAKWGEFISRIQPLTVRAQ